MRAAFYTLGCKVNQYETQIMEQAFETAGFSIVPPEAEADVVVVNSCTVTAESDRKTRQMLHRMKKRSPNAVAVLCGCFVQAAPTRAAAIREADIVAGVRDRAGLPALVLAHLGEQTRLARVTPFAPGEAFEPMRARGALGHTRAFVKIEDGCRSYCSYCIIPQARGPVRSKPAREIADELAALRARGYAEAVLVGINLSAYGGDCGATLADAVEEADRAGLPRIRLGSLSPLAVTDDFALRAARCASLCPHFHLSLQSGSGATLARMNRRYTPAQYAAAAEKLRARFPDCALTTDVIVGFPGETEAEFEESLRFVSEIGFAHVHVFPYSRRAGTAAADLPGQAAEAVKAERARRMAEAAAAAECAFRQRFIGRTLPVLFEQCGQDGVWKGFAPNYLPVQARAGENLHGRILPVRITGINENGCVGEPAPAAGTGVV